MNYILGLGLAIVSFNAGFITHAMWIHMKRDREFEALLDAISRENPPENNKIKLVKG